MGGTSIFKTFDKKALSFLVSDRCVTLPMLSLDPAVPSVELVFG